MALTQGPSVWVDLEHGDDSDPGTYDRPLRTLNAGLLFLGERGGQVRYKRALSPSAPSSRKPGWGWVDAPTFWLFFAFGIAWGLVVGSVVYVLLTLSRSG